MRCGSRVGVRLRDVPASLRPQSGDCITLGVLKADGTGGWYLDLAELQAQQRQLCRKEVGVLLLSSTLISAGLILIVQ
ncbi:MAG: hypothetical protein GAK31_03403 [Stenotrophomonas maltophilia]|uniref:Uncharacterized protein n=1 Tax=Stenotrophomonas maltophilia TaxID=40324 RepID=A0A7V8FDJ4_STEMA|nr:MAG: hypothetical protein GAK31_03403 [Stenotrophomonas maltophilia]